MECLHQVKHVHIRHKVIGEVGEPFSNILHRMMFFRISTNVRTDRQNHICFIHRYILRVGAILLP